MRMLSSFLLLLCFSDSLIAQREVPQFKRGSILLVDETALSNPNSFDYDFSEDLKKPVDEEDLYDQFLEQLPMFNTFKLGKNKGVTEVPIVTRKWETWFTPSTQSSRDEKFSFYSHTTAMTPISVTTQSSTTRKQTTTTQIPRRISNNRIIQQVPRQPPSVFKTPEVASVPAVQSTTSAPWRTTPITTQRPITPTRGTFRTNRPITTTPTTTTTTTKTKTTTTTIAPTSRFRWIVGKRITTPAPVQNWRQPVKNPQQDLRRRISTTKIEDPINRTQPKPVVIHNPNNASKYRGPTYNCRVLNPFTDGHPSEEHNNSCKMLYPGLSLDGTCRCFYKVAGRDERGCATGFIYACREITKRSVVV